MTVTTPTRSGSPTKPDRGSPAATPAALLRRLSLGRCTGALVGLVAVCLYLSATQSVFLTWDNLMNVVRANSVILILALGATFVVISAGIDLSTATATSAAGMVLGLSLHAGWGALPAVALTLAFGVAIGAVNGLLISRLKISFLVVTLGALSIFQSFALVVNDGETVSVFSSPGFGAVKSFVNGDVGPFPTLLLFDVALVLVAGGVLRYTRFGRSLFAVGSNIEAARLNGIKVDNVLLAVYAIAGLAGGVAGVVSVGRLTAASPEADSTLLLTVLAAVLIGGTSYSGGEGGVLGTVIGVAFLGVIQNGLTLTSTSSFWQGIVSGVILIGAVWFGGLRGGGWRTLLRRRGPATPRA